MRKKPNFVMIVSDQQRADWLGCYGHKVIKTPHIDSLAEQGLRFTDFHTASPVCMPNRASILTGRYPSVHGLRYNGCALSTRANTFVELLRQAGYQTAAIGKSHLQPFTPFSIDRTHEHYNETYTEAWKETLEPYVHEEPGRYSTSCRYVFPKPYYGYDHIDMVTGHGIECNGHYRQWLNERTSEAANLTDPKRQLEHHFGVPQACRTVMPEELYPTRYIENQTVNWLNEVANPEQPFFLFVSFPDPHHPFNPPGKYWDRYKPEQFDLENPAESIEDKPPMLQYAHDRLSQGLYPSTSQESFMATTRHCKEAMALTAGMIDMVDDAVGSINQALKDSGLDDDTVIIYTSDHGDYLGDANLLLKGPWIRTSTHQVPFVWRDPEALKVTTTNVMGSAIDIAPTILARAGVTPYFGIQGRDLLHDIDTDEGRQQLLIEHNDNVPRMGLTAPSRSRTLYRKDWRLTIYPGENWGELYHTAADPHHRKNLWFDKEFALKKGELMEQLAVEIAATMDESPRSIRRA